MGYIASNMKLTNRKRTVPNAAFSIPKAMHVPSLAVMAHQVGPGSSA